MDEAGAVLGLGACPHWWDRTRWMGAVNEAGDLASKALVLLPEQNQGRPRLHGRRTAARRELGAPVGPRTAKAGGSGHPAPDPSKQQCGRRSSWAELLVVPHGGSCEEKQREGARCERRSKEPGRKGDGEGKMVRRTGAGSPERRLEPV